MFYKYNKKTTFEKILYWALPVISIVLLLVGYMKAVELNPIVMPQPIEIWNRFVKLATVPVKGSTIWLHVLKSLERVFIGAAVSWILGVVFGIIIAWNKTCDAIFGVLFRIIRPVPAVAWIPVVIFICGVGEFSKYLLVFISCFLVMASQTYGGIKLVQKQDIDVGKIFGANDRQILFKFVLPTALPSIFVGFRSSVDVGWKTILAAEMMGATLGIGALVMRGWSELDMAQVFVCVIIIAITGALLSFLLKKVERLITPWTK